jgi:uncharacterized damage-inducible protein DinB
MSNDNFARLDIVPTWARFNEDLIRLVDYVPVDKLNWSPKPELWNFRGILVHIGFARDQWLGNVVKDGVEGRSAFPRTKEEIAQALRRTWQRVEPFLRDEKRLDATYETDRGAISGHWIAYHLLEHDIHHRADVFHYLALLGIETPDVSTP